MGKQVAVTGAQALDAQRQSMQDRLAGLGGGGSLNFVQVDNKSFVFPEGEIVPAQLEIVILDWALNNQYYDKPFVRGVKTRPACFAVGQSVAQMRPSRNSPSIQNDGNPCATCPMNQFGSGTGNAKACKNQILLAGMLPDEGPEGPIYIVKVSPTAIKRFKEYASKVNDKGIALAQLVTVLTFDSKVTYASLQFAADGPASKAHKPNVGAFAERIPEATEMLLREPSFNDNNDE